MIRKYTLRLILALCITGSLNAQIRLPKLISDGMVLQRNEKLKVWGWAESGEKIRIRFQGKNYSGTTEENGKWEITLPEFQAGGPYEMTISGKRDKLSIKDILIGDVWMCTGQSNMVHYLDLHKERYQREIEQANYPQIRQFLVPTNAVLTGPVEDVHEGSWNEANPQNVLRFSVVAYFFAKNLYDQYQVPIGLINSSVGGTPIEAWTSAEGLKEFPTMQETIERNKDTTHVNLQNRIAQQASQEFYRNLPSDAGMTESPKWFQPEYKTQNWGTLNIPGYWEDQGIDNLNGVVWYRKEINIPAGMVGKMAKVALGRIVDADQLWINGKQVGNTTYQYPQRRYSVPEDLLKAGKNTFVIRVTNQGGKGGFVPDKPYYLATDTDTLDLKGYWHYKVGSAYPNTPSPSGGISLIHQPSALFNGMIAPFTNFPVKGILWYQGESNAGRPKQYAELQPAQIKDYRTKWNNDELPFLLVQLPNFMEVNYIPSESSWAELRSSQLKSLNVPNTGMAVTIDLGEWNDIHPGNKKPIGDRLALAARKLAYDEEVFYSGPIFKSAFVEDGKVELTFDHVGSGLISKDNQPLRWFSLAGADGQFHWARAEIKNNSIVLRNEKVKNPIKVRYAWADNPENVNFYNKEGLPASPFEAEIGKTNELWFGKKAAVVLTYDDALEVHLDNAIPILDSLGFKGSFYLSASFPGSKNRLEDWKRAARNGHELGNHTLYHPCDNSDGSRAWLTEENDLANYSTAQIVREVEMTNIFLQALDGKTERTFAYTCGDTETAEGSFIDAIKDKFVALRGVHGELNKPGSLNISNLNTYVVDNSNADQMKVWAEKARQEGALLVLLFHGVGGGHSGNIDLDKHNDFLKCLKANEEDFWVTTLIDAVQHVEKQPQKH